MKEKLIFAIVASCVGSSATSMLTSWFDFDGDLAATYSNGHSSDLVFVKGGAMPSGNGNPSYVFDTIGSVVKRVAFFGKTEGFQAYHGVGKNGGGDKANIYSILMDIKLISTTGVWASMLQTNPNNWNDGDMFWKQGSGFGASGDYSNSTPPFGLNAWHRVIMAVDTVSNLMNIYVDGNLANSVTTTGVDGEWGLYAWNGSSVHHFTYLFMDNDGENGSGYISSLAFYDSALSPDEVRELGGPGSSIPSPAATLPYCIGLALYLTRRNRKPS